MRPEVARDVDHRDPGRGDALVAEEDEVRVAVAVGVDSLDVDDLAARAGHADTAAGQRTGSISGLRGAERIRPHGPASRPPSVPRSTSVPGSRPDRRRNRRSRPRRRSASCLGGRPSSAASPGTGRPRAGWAPRSAASRAGPEYNTSIFYKKFVTDSLLLKNASQQVDLAYKPKLSVTADGGFVSSLTYTPYKNFGFGAALNLTIPIYDGNQRRLQYQRLNILEQTRISNRDFYTNQYYQQIAQLSQQLQTTEQIINETKEQLKYVRTLLDANKKLLITGEVNIAEYIIAIGNYLNAQNTITQSVIQKYQIITQINYWNR